MADAGQIASSTGSVAAKATVGLTFAGMVTKGRDSYLAMPSARRSWLLAALLLIGAVVAATIWFAQRTDWRPLFNGLEGRDLQQVSQELGAAGIPFETTPDGTGIQVPSELVDKARMEVAAKGMPQSGRLGFELFDKPNWVGSEFDEKVNYQRALEGELEHTIGTLEAVRSARVHLVLPRETLFSGEERGAKASVVLKLRRSTMTSQQIDSVRNLVASAVDNLSPEQVTLVDADGRVNLNSHGAAGPEGDAEQAMETKLVAMLEPLAGVGNVRAVVKQTYDQGSEERNDEVYDPTLVAPLSIQKSEQSSNNAARASGVPGTASNTPAAAVQGAVQGSSVAAAPGTPPLLQPKETSKDGLPVYPQSGGTVQSTKQESATYGVSKHTTHSESLPGRLERVSAAVVINDRQTSEGTGKDAKQIWRPRTTEEMHRLEMLAQAAVGFDVKRGDQVILQNVSFSTNLPEVKGSVLENVLGQTRTLLALQPGMLRTLITGVVGLMVIWFVLRPVANEVVRTLKDASAMAPGRLPREQHALTDAHSAGGTQPALGQGNTGDWDRGKEPEEVSTRRPLRRDAVFEQVAEHIKRSPTQSTRILETWISPDGEGE